MISFYRCRQLRQECHLDQVIILVWPYEILQDTFGSMVLSGEHQTEASRPGKFLTNFVSELSFPSFQNPTARAVFILYVLSSNEIFFSFNTLRYC